MDMKRKHDRVLKKKKKKLKENSRDIKTEDTEKKQSSEDKGETQMLTVLQKETEHISWLVPARHTDSVYTCFPGRLLRAPSFILTVVILCRNRG